MTSFTLGNHFKSSPLSPPLRPRRRLQQDPVQWAIETLGFTPDHHQSQVLNTAHRRILVNCCRQWGKSTTAAIRALYHAHFRPASETVIIAPSLRQSTELMRKVRHFAALCPVAPTLAARKELTLPNGSRILALPSSSDTIRGYSNISLMIVDEAAYVRDSLFYAVRSFLAAAEDAALLIMSTPNGDAGFFHRAWSSHLPWQRITVPATECPRIATTFLDEERRLLSERLFRQEYLCEFLSHDNAVFDRDRLATFFTDTQFGQHKPFRFEL
jgi:hypothetical protein